MSYTTSEGIVLMDTHENARKLVHKAQYNEEFLTLYAKPFRSHVSDDVEVVQNENECTTFYVNINNNTYSIRCTYSSSQPILENVPIKKNDMVYASCSLPNKYVVYGYVQ